MQDNLKEWISKAEGDFHSAMRESRARKDVNCDAACFHAQQCVEKYLKAVSVTLEVRFSKTHDLYMLATGCLGRFPHWALWRDELEWLSQFAVLFRYPGESAGRPDAIRALRIVKRLRSEFRQLLRLHP